MALVAVSFTQKALGGHFVTKELDIDPNNW